MSLNIVHIGKGTALAEIDHIVELRTAGHDVYVPGDSTYEQLVRRIIDADEIHIFDTGMVFELGMIYLFSVHAQHYGLGWVIKMFGDPNPADKFFTLFTQHARMILLPAAENAHFVQAREAIENWPKWKRDV